MLAIRRSLDENSQLLCRGLGDCWEIVAFACFTLVEDEDDVAGALASSSSKGRYPIADSLRAKA